MFVRLNENFFFCYLSLAQFAEDIKKKTTLRLEVYYMVRYVIKELSVWLILRYDVVHYAINNIGETLDQEAERVDD